MQNRELWQQKKELLLKMIENKFGTESMNNINSLSKIKLKRKILKNQNEN